MYQGYGQQQPTQIGSFKEIEQNGISEEELLKEYPNRVDADLKLIEESILDSLQQKMWLRFWYDFDKSLSMKFKKKFYVFHEFCFDEDGHLDYFVYRVDPKVAKKEFVKEYEKLLKEHASNFDWVVVTGAKWSQCGTWDYNKHFQPHLYK
ncbi:MAG: hypothetical protein CMP48_26655 [Rickettsiales bacterium]|nr:hypothetical protein [Rickettsiales bacterium]